MESGVHNFFAQESNELLVQFKRQQDRVRAHALENLLGDGSDAWAVLDNHPRFVPVDLVQNVIHQEIGSWE